MSPSKLANAYAEYVASRDIVETIETQMLAPAPDVRATTEYSYRRGEATFVEFLDAVRAFNDTMQSYNEARASFARSLYTLDAIVGQGDPMKRCCVAFGLCALVFSIGCARALGEG